ISAKGVAGVNADADDIARSDEARIEGVERFVDDHWRSESIGRRGGEHVQPSRGDDRSTERQITRVYEMYSHVYRPQKDARSALWTDSERAGNLLTKSGEVARG